MSTPASPRRRVLAQGGFETRTILRNGEQLLVTFGLPLIVLVGLVKTTAVLDTGGISRIDFVVPGLIAMAVMSTAFTSQAILTAFDRRNGVLRLLATTPLGRTGLLLGKALAVGVVLVVQAVILGAVALALGWRPSLVGLLVAVPIGVLGTVAFTSLALLMAGTMRPEGVLALANLLLVVLLVAGGTIAPASAMPPALRWFATYTPSGALGDALRAVLVGTGSPWGAVGLLAGWTVVLTGLAGRFFRWAE
jgi:ABC-2 type transport system permease protein